MRSKVISFVLLLCLLLVGGQLLPGKSAQRQIMEYYIYYKGSFIQYYGQRYEHAYATREEAEKARQQAAIDTRGGAEDFLAHTYIEEVPTGRYITEPAQPDPTLPPATPTSPEPTPPPTISTSPQTSPPAPVNNTIRTTPTTPSFDQGKKDLVRRLKRGIPTEKDEVVQARVALEKMDVATLVSIKSEIYRRQAGPNPWSEAIRRSLKIKAPPLPDKMFSQLQPGDVLLVAPEDDPTTGAFWSGHYIRLFDKLTSWEWNSYASHSCIYLKEVKGVKFFLDNIPGEGPRIKTEDQIIKEYGERYIDVARARRPGVAQPVSKIDAEKLWAAARELGIKQLNSDVDNLGNTITRIMNWTNYGFYGNENMVCSEASRFVLIKAGLDIPDTNSPFKKLLGTYFGPANFYSSEQYFLITPLAKLPQAAGR